MSAIRALKLKNVFSHKDTTIEFKNGFTAITGKNGVGKSLILEMIRYALFGTKALRSAAGRYPKDMAVTLFFVVGEDDYTVTRSKSDTLLVRNATPLASGTKTVDQKVIEVLGYDLKVFDVANCAMQGQLEILSRMKPTERKTMVDNVIGLDIIDKLKDKLSDKLTIARAQVNLLGNQLALEPIKPAAPAGYVDSTTLANNITVLEAQNNELNQLLGFFAQPAPVAGDEPVTQLAPLAQLEVLAAKEAELLAEYQTLQGQLSGIKAPEISISEAERGLEQLERYQAYQTDQQRLKALVPPKYTGEERFNIGKALDALEAYNNAIVVRRKIDNLKTAMVECPNCTHTFCPTDVDGVAQKLAALEEELSELNAPAVAPTPLLTEKQWEEMEDYADWYESPAVQEELAALNASVSPGEPTQNAAYYQYQIEMNKRNEAAEALRPRFAELCEWVNGRTAPSCAERLQMRREHDIRHAHWSQQKTRLEAYQAEAGEKQARRDVLASVPAALQNARAMLQVSIAYETQLRHYDEQRDVYAAKMADKVKREAELDQYLKAREAVVNIKSTVKKYLVPSLNQVASTLISHMTEGALSNVTVSEDFEITVDDLLINELSGSGEAVANLAIRIALGQVLTNKRFSLFMADEIDGSMDADRAAYTFHCLKNLNKAISQILIVSHKALEADHYVELGKS